MIIFPSSKFQRSLKKLLKKSPELKDKFDVVLDLMSVDPFSPSLKSHKLSGKLKDSWSCSVAYDCRITFCFEQDPETESDIIILLDIGSHDEVYD